MASFDPEAIAQNTDALRIVQDASNLFYFTFKPRPDRPEIFDEQESFINSRDRGVSFHVGGNGSGTTEAACYKLAQFVLNVQAPPRPDTPFWVIGATYEQVIEACWKEKLFGHGHIPETEIDWDRVTWYSPRSGLPLRVPLKPWPNQPKKNNWCIEFRSYEQGREKMQARSLGGFMFSEQFPWDVLVEVLRGMREYNFPGSKFAEFTPVDPTLSRELEEMIENDSLPDGWNIYRANTLANVEDPNSDVGEDWFREFFGMVSEEMRETRLTGAFASYEGVIYPSFNRSIHLVENIEIPNGVIHKRGVDWGAGGDNPFVVLWGFKDSLGAWWIYDEYYATRQDWTWEDHFRKIHEKDGWTLSLDEDLNFGLLPIPGTKQRWHYSDIRYQETYAPPDRPDMFRESARYLMPVSSANNSVLDGIDTVRRCLKIDENTNTGMYIDRISCPNLARFIQTYRWKRGAVSGRNPQDPRPEPLKKDDHAPDALRYLVHSDYVKSMTGAFGRRIEHRRLSSIRHKKTFGIPSLNR